MFVVSVIVAVVGLPTIWKIRRWITWIPRWLWWRYRGRRGFRPTILTDEQWQAKVDLITRLRAHPEPEDPAWRYEVEALERKLERRFGPVVPGSASEGGHSASHASQVSHPGFLPALHFPPPLSPPGAAANTPTDIPLRDLPPVITAPATAASTSLEPRGSGVALCPPGIPASDQRA